MSVSAGLQGRGVAEGDRILIHCENCPEMLVAILACAAVGAVAVTTNTSSTQDELTYFTHHTRAMAAITQPQYAELVRSAAPHLRWVAVTADNSGEPPSPDFAADPIGSWTALSGDADHFAARTADPMLPYSIMFTSGTTSRPKAVVQTHANALWASRTGPRNIDLTADDVYLIYLPLFHVNAVNWSFFAVLGVGATAVLMPKWSKSRFWPVASRHGATHISMMPFVIPLLSEPTKPANRLRVATYGRDLPGLHESTGLSIYTAFGMTETVTHAIGAKPGEGAPLNTIGRVLPGYEMIVVDQDTGDLCGDGKPGELWIRGTRGVQLFLEYADDAAANKAAFENGWFKTGDLVRMLPGGIVVYHERHKDLLKVGGENVSAREVEDCINQVPGVGSAAVVGRSHDFLDQVVVAFVIPGADAPSSDELARRVMEACSAHLSRFKVPRAVHVVPEFPLGTLDKILKKRLREMAESLPITD